MTDTTETSIAPESLDELRGLVHAELCSRENLVAELFPLRERPIRRGDSLCGLQFTLHGPRNVRLSAVWNADRNTVYLYDTQGVRYGKHDVAGHLTLMEGDLRTEPIVATT